MSYNPRDDRSRRSYSDDYGDGYNISNRSKKNYHFETFEDTDSSNQRANRSGTYSSHRSSSASHSASRSSSEHRRSKQRKKKSSGKKRFISVLLAIVLLLGGAAFIFCYNVLNSINYVDVDDNNDALIDPDSGEKISGSLLNDEKVLNVLLFGVDENNSDYGRSDTMILLSIDSCHEKIKLTSFQRDTFVYCPDPEGSYHTKLTNAYSYGGVPLAIDTIEANYGVEIDRYATVDFSTFKSIVDILGGVEVELTDDEILYINCQIAQNNQTEYLYADAGNVLLNGQQALWYARNRGGDIINGVDFTEGTDWDRTERQRKFIKAVIDDMKDASVPDIVRIVNSIGPEITTNLKKSEILSIAADAKTYLNYEVEQTSMPCEGSWIYDTNFAGDVIYVTDWDMTRNAIWKFIYEDNVTGASVNE
ncbi:MAG: LCP family protein [Ruminococcus sp.]